MNSDKIYCVGSFPYGSYNRYPAGANKFRYVVDSITAQLRTKVELVSVSLMNTEGIKKQKISDDLEVVYLIRNTSSNRIVRRMLDIFYRVKLFLYLIKRLDQNSVLLVYHNPRTIRSVLLAKFFKRFKLILEVEEVYADVEKSDSLRRKEFKTFRAADAFIFPTLRLNGAVNLKNKPLAIAHGVYKSNEIIGEKFSRKDGKTHLVYAGTLSKIKGGAFLAVKSTEYLSEKYHMHILGFGTSEELKEIQEAISSVSSKTKCALSYDGVLQGEAFARFLQSCDIGMSTQTPLGAYNDTSFPSKVLTYLANGLQVASVRIPVLEESEVADLIRFYDEDDPRAVAEAIRTISERERVDVRTRLNELDVKFGKELKQIFESVERRSK